MMGTIIALSFLAGCGSNNSAPDPDFKPTAEMEEMAEMAQ